MNESDKILRTQFGSKKNLSGNFFSPSKSIYTTIGNKKSRDYFANDNQLYQSELNFTQNNLYDLNNSYQINTTLGNQNTRTKSNPRLNTNNILYNQNFKSKHGNIYTNLKPPKELLSNTNLNINNTMNNLNNNNLNNILNNSKAQNNINNIHNNVIAQNVSINNIKDENERLKLSNAVLSKSNLDLKNQVRLLQIEINATSSGNPDSMQSRLEEDPQIATFIQNLRTALNTSQNSNQELTAFFDGMQKKNSELSKENLILKEQNELANKEVESLTKKFSETRYSIDELTSELRKLENEKTVMLIHKNDFEEKYKLAEEKVENLLSINESHIKCKNDNLEMIENLKITIETLKRNNGENDSNKSNLIHKIEELDTLLKEKAYNMESLESKLKNYESDREYFNQDLKLMEREVKEKDKFIESLQQKYHEINTENEKSKSKIEAFQINISERDQTIQNLKSSISFISTTIEDYKQDYEKIKTQTDGGISEKNKLSKELELSQKKLGDISAQYETMKKEKETLQKRNLDVENELNEKKMSLSKLNFEMDILVQKLESNQTIMENLQDEMKNSKILKINEEFHNEISKTNEERNKRFKELEKTISMKNKMIEELQQQIQDMNIQKDERLTDLQTILNKRASEGKEMEYKMNDEIFELKNAIEISRQEVLLFKNEKEKENIDIQNKYNLLKSDYEILEQRLKSREKQYQETIQNMLKSSNSSNYGFVDLINNNLGNSNLNSNSDNKSKIDQNLNSNYIPLDNTYEPKYKYTYEVASNLVQNQIVPNNNNLNAEEILKKVKETTANLQDNTSNAFTAKYAFDPVVASTSYNNANIYNSNVHSIGAGIMNKTFLTNSGNFYGNSSTSDNKDIASKKLISNAEINKIDANNYNILNSGVLTNSNANYSNTDKINNNNNISNLPTYNTNNITSIGSTINQNVNSVGNNLNNISNINNKNINNNTISTTNISRNTINQKSYLAGLIPTIDYGYEAGKNSYNNNFNNNLSNSMSQNIGQKTTINQFGSKYNFSEDNSLKYSSSGNQSVLYKNN